MEDTISRRARENFGDTKRRCTATNRAGERCGRAPIAGGFVCTMHGGNLPWVREAAKQRLMSMIEPALDVVYRALRHAPPCEHCGRSDAERAPVALAAAKTVLDRAGFSPQLAITVTQQPPDAECVQWIPSERLELMAEWIADAKAAMVRGERPSQDFDVIDGQLELPEGDEPQG